MMRSKDPWWSRPTLAGLPLLMIAGLKRRDVVGSALTEGFEPFAAPRGDNRFTKQKGLQR